jgi:hypothetical protein
MVKNIFQNKYAEVLIARIETSDGIKGEAVGLALVSFYREYILVLRLITDSTFLTTRHGSACQDYT